MTSVYLPMDTEELIVMVSLSTHTVLNGKIPTAPYQWAHPYYTVAGNRLVSMWIICT